MKNSFGPVSLIFCLLLSISNVLSAADIYTPPALDETLPPTLDLPEDFQPPAKGRREYFGFRRMSAVVLEKQGGTTPFCVTQSSPHIIAGDPLQVGDVVFAINGKPLVDNPIRHFRKILDQGKKTTGLIWISRWRPSTDSTGSPQAKLGTGKGTVEQIMIDLGTKPLDLTRTGKPGNTRDWALGPIGVNGWGFSRNTANGASQLARQLIVTRVDPTGPAAGTLKLGDVILGVHGKKFSDDARKVLAAAINEAEKEENGGKLNLQVWRPLDAAQGGEGTQMTVMVSLPVMGTYSETAPYDCPKTDTIIDNAVEHMKRNKDTLLKPDVWISYINGLGLMATGREDILPLVRELAHGSLLKDGETLSIEKHVGMMCWRWSYKTLFLTEYHLLTGDKTVLPTIDEYATKIAMGQSGAGTWGHTYAAIENVGALHGPLGGYGAINQQGLTLMIDLPLAVKCGIKNQEVLDAIQRGNEFFSYFIGRGTIPYGDHGPANSWYDDNGKSGAAAIFFDLMDNRQGAQFFSDMVLGSTPSGREAGHTGHFWSHLWGGIGAARGGDKSLRVFMKEMDYIFTLERQHDGRMVFQGNVGEAGDIGKPKDKWDSTGSRLLQLCVPRRVLYITGRSPSGDNFILRSEPATTSDVNRKSDEITGKGPRRDTHLKDDRINQILAAGRLDIDADGRAGLTVERILELLRDPLPPTRSIGAKTLAEQDLNIVDQLIPMLDSENRYARYGAAEALCKAGFGNKAAADKLIELMATDKDITFRNYAIDALINRDEKRGLLTVSRPAIPVLLKMAVERSPDDPRGVLQQRVALALFYNGNAQPRRGLLFKYGLESADRSLLLPAIRAILTNQNGGTRSLTGWTFAQLTPDEMERLWADLYKSSRYIAPSGIMFSAGIRAAGLKIMADYHIAEGLDLAIWHILHNRGHGSVRVPDALAAIEKYGAHAKRIIPRLEECHAYWLERDGRRKNETSPSTLIRKAINRIKALPDAADFELVSIADEIKDVENPYETNNP